MAVDAQALVDEANASIQEYQSSVASVLTTLEDAAALPYLSWFDFATVTPPVLATPGQVALGDIPAFQAAVLGVAPAFSYTPQMFDALEAQVLAIVQSGGQNITPAVQDAVFNQGYERLMQTQRDLLDLTGAKTGAKGFRYPNSMTKAQQQQISTEFSWQRSDLSRQIIREFADMAQKNLQMAINAGVEIERVEADIAVKVYTVALEGLRTMVDKFKAETSANVEVYSAQLKGALAQLEADMDNARLTIQEQEQCINLFRATSQNIIEMGRAQIVQGEEANRMKLEAIKGVVDAYVRLVQTVSAQAVSVVTKKT